MDDDQQYCLRWNNHQSTLISVFDTLLENETLVDCTLAAEGKILKAHKVVLSACSPYFATLLQEQYDKHPVFILKDVKYQELRAMMDYMYRGEVNISQDQLAALLKAAESLQIKGLSDNRAGSSAAAAAPKPEQHLRGKMGTGYTLEQTKRARMATGAMDAQDVSGSREGSSSPSRRRRKVRRRSMENDAHDNSNSSVMQAAASNQLILQQSNAASALVATQMPIAAGVSIAPGSAHTSATGVAGATQGTTQQQVQPLTTTSVNKKTDSAKGITTSISTAAAAVQQSAVQTSEVINTENVQVASGSSQCGAVIVGVEEQDVKSGGDKANHKQKLSKEATTSAGGSEMVIEPKAEYDDEGHEETVEDLTLDDEEIGMEELDQTAGTSQGGEGSSQGYAAWQHDRSQEELLLATQEAQQRDPQAKHDKSEQTDITAEEYELDDCLLESNDIVITQNKDGFVLHVKKLGNITTAKLATTDEDQAAAAAVAAVTGGHQTATITELQQVPVEVKPTLTTLTTNQAIKLPSTECELINLKKIIPASTTISTHQPHAKATIIQQHQIQPSQQHQTQIQQIPTQHQQHHHQLQQAPTHAQVQSIVTTHAGQTINMMGLRNVQIEPIVSRIKYSRGKIITPTAGGSVQIVEAHEALSHQQHHELTEGTKYEISEIDLTNPNTSAAIISDLVKYAEIDDIELPDGTKIGIGFAPTEITEHIQTTSGDTHLTTIEHEPQVTTIQHQQHEHEQPQSSSAVHQMQQQQHTQIQTHHIHHQELSESEQQQQHQQLHQLHEHEEGVETIIPDHITVHEQTKSYTILTTRPMKTDTSDAGGETTTTTYELSLSDSSMGAVDDPEARYVCRHCGKKYRWKSTLRRHENVECGGKEPCHPCPYCTYKAKQRGNLGVHVRKHHPDKPQLESKRGRKI